MGPASGTCLPELAVVNRLSPALIIPGRLVGSSVHPPRVVGCAGRRARRADAPTGAVHRRPVVDASCRTPLWTLAAPSARSARTAPRRTERTTHACSRSTSIEGSVPSAAATPILATRGTPRNWSRLSYRPAGRPSRSTDFIFGDALDFIACVLGDAAGWLVRSDRPVVVHFRHRVRHIASACRCSRQD